MNRREQARALFEQGHNFNHIARKLNTAWSQARAMADPDGDWRKPTLAKACHVCGVVKEPSEFRVNQNCVDRIESTCKVCKFGYKPRPRAGSYPTPNNIYGCPYCGTPRDKTGRWYKSQAEADTCCEHGETYTKPYKDIEYATEHGYGQIRHRIRLGGR